jgi:hypothetical protein
LIAEEFAVGTSQRGDEEFDDEHYSDDSSDDDSGERSLLEAVLRETMGSTNQEALELIFSVARESKYEDTTTIEAVAEVVRKIIQHRFGERRFSERAIKRIAHSLVEAPEATIRLERLWQEARSSE